MDKKILGIDLRVSSVKVVEVDLEPNPPRLEKWGTEKIPSDLLNKQPEKEAAQAQALKRIITKNNITTKEAVVIIGSSDVLVSNVSLPQLPKNEIKQAIALKVEKAIDYPLAGAVYDYYQVPGTSDFVLVIVKRAVIEGIRKICTNIGLKLVSVSIVPEALAAVFAKKMDKGVTSIIYMGELYTNISIFKGKTLLFNRAFAVAGDAITRAMVGTVIHDKGTLNLDAAAAEKLKLEHGIPVDFESYSQKSGLPADKIFSMVRPAMEKIEAEILCSFQFSGAAVSRIILTGGSAKTPNLIQQFEQALSVKVESGEPTVACDDKAKPALMQLSVAIGAALKNKDLINLLPEEYQYPWRSKLKFLLGWWTVVALVFLIVLLAWGSLRVKEQGIKVELDKLRELKKIEDSKQLVHSQAAKLVASQQISDRFVKVFKSLDKVTPKMINFRSLNYNNASGELVLQGVVMKGASEEKNDLADYIAKLMTTGLFQSIDLVKMLDQDKYTVPVFEFELKAKLSGGS